MSVSVGPVTDFDFEGERATLLAIARRTTGDDQDAQDVVQEVSVRYLAHQDSLENPAHWLRLVTRRAAIDVVRVRQRQRRTTWQVEASVRPGATDPVDVVLEKERLESGVRILFEYLTPLERIAFVSRELCQLPYADIAARLRRSEPAVRQLYHRAAARVRHGFPRFDASPDEVASAVRAVGMVPCSGTLDELLRWFAPGWRPVPDHPGMTAGPRSVPRTALAC